MESCSRSSFDNRDRKIGIRAAPALPALRFSQSTVTKTIAAEPEVIHLSKLLRRYSRTIDGESCLRRRSGGHQTRDVVPPFGVGDKGLKRTSGNHAGESKDKIWIPGSAYERLGENEEKAQNQHRDPWREDRMDRSQDRRADKQSRALHAMATGKKTQAVWICTIFWFRAIAGRLPGRSNRNPNSHDPRTNARCPRFRVAAGELTWDRRTMFEPLFGGDVSMPRLVPQPATTGGRGANLGKLGFLSCRDSYARKMARPERFELPTFWFVARRSIQLS